MSRYVNSPVIAALGGFFFTAPFLILEWINTPGFWSKGIPPLFFIMWLSGSFFTFILGSVLRGVQDKKKINLFSLIVKAALLLLLAWIFVGLVIDQWACLMGIPNCD